MANSIDSGSMTRTVQPVAEMKADGFAMMSATDRRLPPLARTVTISALAIGSWALMAAVVWAVSAAF